VVVLVCWEISGSMWTYDFVVVLESTMVQYSAPGVCQMTVPHLALDVTIASKYEVLIKLGVVSVP
jgi:hypothetical protein